MRYLNSQEEGNKPNTSEIVSQDISIDLNENKENLHTLLQGCSDAVFKEFAFGPNRDNQGLILYFDGLTDRNEIEENILKPVLLEVNMINTDIYPDKPYNLLNYLKNSVLAVTELKNTKTLQEICHHISSGDTVVLIDGYDQGLVIGTRSWQTRSIQTPDSEVVIRGPKEGFTETIRFNTALLRRRIKTTNFKMESFVIGRLTKTDVVVGYIEGIAPKTLVDEVKDRLNKIDIDGVLDSGYLEEFLEEHHYTIFSQMEYTEKPDRICAHLLEGRVCIMVDGSPEVLTLPTSFPRFLISPEDYYERYIPSSLFRIMRFLAFWLALLLPSLFVSIITFHHEMIPTALFLTIAATRETVPFPAFVEALLLELTFELLREAGLRLPRSIGPAVSIVGALIIGDAAVKAGLVSTPMVVVVAFTGIASFVAPSYNGGIIIRIARFGFLIFAGFLGLFGIMLFFILIMTRMVSLSSFGIPYLSPLIPLDYHQITDIIVRRPWIKNNRRPDMKGMENEIRQKSNNNSSKE
jgi:spore germination protein KA